MPGRIVRAAHKIVQGHIEVVGEGAQGIAMWIVLRVFKLANGGGRYPRFSSEGISRKFSLSTKLL